MIQVIKPGLYTSVQDLGRFKSLHYGVPVSGCMDQTSARIANAILNNTSDCAVLEMTLKGGHFRFKVSTNLCITGADMSPRLNNSPVKMYTTIPVHAGDELILHRAIQGSRSYLAVSKGIQTPKILNSRSMYQGVTESFRISKGDELAIDESPIKLKSNAVVKGRIESPENIFLKAFKGPEFNQLKTHQIETLGSMYFTISKESSRMAFPLEENFSNQLDPIITSLVLPGTVQLTPGGKLIILMRDSQITGGYPRILQLTKVAINTLAQKQLKDKIRFTII
tara:strand:- start:5833 stop:6675 length:843 start_codon:yes stop_codon:yes gene_type:complete